MKKLYLILSTSIFYNGCLFDNIDQPDFALNNDQIEIHVSVLDNIPETTNPHKGLFAVLVPDDWNFISASFTESWNQGSFTFSQDWTDSVSICYPPNNFSQNMKWICLLSDTGYTYQNEINITIELKLETGERAGCFQLAYLVTKATPNLVCSGNLAWAPLSYPHPINVGGTEYCETSPADPETEWSNLFHRYQGWSGADGIYSIPMNGSEENAKKTLIVFSDTFIGAVDSLTNQRIAPTRMVNNTYAILNGNQAIEDSINFFFNTDENNNPISIFEPETPNAQNGDWYWLMDGVSIRNTIYLYALRMNADVAPFSIDGVALITFQIDSVGNLMNVLQYDTPLFYEYENGDQVVYGQAIMPLTEFADVPSPDGYIYFYGVYNLATSNLKKMTVARTLEENLTSYDEWQFWDGTFWVNNLSQAEKITENISQEFSVTQLGSEHYIAVFQYNGVGNYVAYRSSNSPTGPFNNFNFIWDVPEYGHYEDVSAYNAKAHPNLSQPNRLLISYNVNTTIGGDFWYHFERGDLYRPRFISFPIDEIEWLSAPSGSDNEIKKVKMHSFFCYPNPFNSSINILFQENKLDQSELSIYSINGKEVYSSKISAKQNYFIWNGLSQRGMPLSSGTYLIQLRMNNNITNEKIVLIK